MDFLINLLYDLLVEGMDQEQESKMDELLNVPLGIHPEQTTEAKARRAAMLGKIMDEQEG